MPYASEDDKKAHAKAYYAKNRERQLASSTAYYYANREAQLAKAKARHDAEAKRQYDREYSRRPEVRARRAEQRKAWAAANATKNTAHNRTRSLVRRNARPDGEAKEYIEVLHGDPCVYCGAPADHVDHIVPLKSGGTSAWDNLTASCQACNYAKRVKPLLAFLATR